MVRSLVEGVEARGEPPSQDELAKLLVIHAGRLPEESLRPREALLHCRLPQGAADPVPHPHPVLPLIKGLGYGLGEGGGSGRERRKRFKGSRSGRRKQSRYRCRE